MASPPWKADRTLTPERVRGAIQGQFPELGAAPIEWVGAGWDNDVYLVGGEWIFRFPRRRVVADGLPTEIDFMPIIAEALADCNLRVPSFEKLGRPDRFFPYPFVGYRRLGGIRGDAVPRERLAIDLLARELGRAFSRLHAIPAERVRHLALPVERDGPGERLRALVERSTEIRPLLAGDLVSVCGPWLSGSVPASPAYPGPSRLIHDDICPDHILVDESTGRPTGLLDFADLAFGDPALDFVCLYCWLGRPFVHQVLASYELPLDDGFHDRLSFLARVMSLLWLGDASLEEAVDRIPKHQGWVRAAFEP
jgi:aminoglycoside phosphotransferase (APT) family kinase protein